MWLPMYDAIEQIIHFRGIRTVVKLHIVLKIRDRIVRYGHDTFFIALSLDPQIWRIFFQVHIGQFQAKKFTKADRGIIKHYHDCCISYSTLAAPWC